jgi:hypothetical protein
MVGTDHDLLLYLAFRFDGAEDVVAGGLGEIGIEQFPVADKLGIKHEDCQAVDDKRRYREPEI